MEKRNTFFSKRASSKESRVRESTDGLRRTSVYFSQADWEDLYEPFQEKHSQSFSAWVREKLLEERDR